MKAIIVDGDQLIEMPGWQASSLNAYLDLHQALKMRC
jgi:hypothetical protein